MNRKVDIMLFGVLTFVMGGLSGAAVWAVLKIMHLGMVLLWETIPQALGLSDALGYTMAVCIVGGLIIGLWQRRHGILPDDMHQVMGRIKAEGGYPYDKLPVIAVSALLPLIFGGAIGPEAGLSGFIAGLCTLIGDRLKYKGDRVAAMAETGFAATLGVVFGAPLFGIAENLEPDDRSEQYRKKLLSKKERILLYCMGVAGGMLTLNGLGKLLGNTGSLPRFSREHAIGIGQWKWALLLMAVGIVGAILFLAADKAAAAVGEALKKHRIVSCVIAGAILGLAGYFVPQGMFSGEEQLAELIGGWAEYSAPALLLMALAKLLLVNVCIHLGWRGGSIFPMIFSGAALGYAVAALKIGGATLGLDGGFAVAMVIAAMCGYIMRKPVSVIAILLLCFPVTYLLPIAVTACVAAKVPRVPGL